MNETMITGIDHFTINVLDKEASLWFYGVFLGLPELDIINLKDQEIRYYGLTNNCRLELIDYEEDSEKHICQISSPTGRKDVASLQRAKGCYRHMALLTDHLDEFYIKVVKYGIPVRMEPTIMKELGIKGILIEDPNGVEIEIVERL